MKRTHMKNDPEALNAIQKLIDHGYSPELVRLFMTDLLVKEINKKNILRDKKNLTNIDETISADYLKFIKEEFILFVGPVAHLIIDEEIEKMGFDQKLFPKDKVPELLNNITSEFEGSQHKKKHFIAKILKSSQTF